MRNIKIAGLVVMLMIAGLFLVGCGCSSNNGNYDNYAEQYEEQQPGHYAANETDALPGLNLDGAWVEESGLSIEFDGNRFTIFTRGSEANGSSWFYEDSWGGFPNRVVEPVEIIQGLAIPYVFELSGTFSIANDRIEFFHEDGESAGGAEFLFIPDMGDGFDLVVIGREFFMGNFR